MPNIKFIKSDKLKGLYRSFMRRKKVCPHHDGTWWNVDRSSNTIKLNYKPLKIVRDFHYSKAKHRALGGGYGDGKSLGLCQECLAMAFDYPGTLGLIGCATYQQTKDATLKTFLDICPKELIDKYRATPNPDIYFKNGSHIMFRALTATSEEDRVKFKNMNLGFFAMDQAEGIDVDVWELLRDRLRQDPSPRRSIVVFNMQGHNWIWKKWVKEVELGKLDPEEYNLFVAKSIENPYLPEDYIFDLIAGNPEEWVARYVEGSFSVFKGKIFKDFEEDKHTIPYFEPPKEWTRYRSIDWGMLNPCGVLWYAVDDKNNRYYYGESYEKGLVVPAQAATIKSSNHSMWKNPETGVVEPHQFLWTTIDPTTNRADAATGETIKEMFDYNGVPTINANNDVAAGLERVMQGFRSGKVKIMKNCINLIDEIQNYRWVVQKNTGLEKPQKVHDHLIDALRYAEMSDPTHHDYSLEYDDDLDPSVFASPITGY